MPHRTLSRGSFLLLAAAATLLLAAAALLLAACTSDSPDATQPPAPTPTASPTPSVTRTPTPTVTPTPTPEPRDPTLAPEGRTDIPKVDALIEALLTADEAELASLYGGIGARTCTDDAGLHSEDNLAADEWPALLAATDRQLFSVARENVGSFDLNVVLTVITDGDLEPWVFDTRQERVVGLRIGCDVPAQRFTPSPGSRYERFLVLPPLEFVPAGPPRHPLTIRSGDPDVDAVLAVIEDGNPDALLGLVDYTSVECSDDDTTALECTGTEQHGDAVDVIVQRECSEERSLRRADFVERRLGEAIVPGTQLHAIARIPQGFPTVDADYSVLLLNPGHNPYDWSSRAIHLRDGRIVGWETGCSDRVTSHYPPLAYLVPPGAGANAAGGAAPTGIPVIDQTIAAFEANDIDLLEPVIDWEILGCLEPGVSLGIGQPPHCEADEQPGDLLETFTFASCEGRPTRRLDALAALAEYVQDTWTLYAATDRGPVSGEFGTRYQLIFEGGTREFTPAFALNATEDGLRWLWVGCGPTDPELMLQPGYTPDFLIPPPSDG